MYPQGMVSRYKVITIVNQKGGTGKTTTTTNLGIGLVNEGKSIYSYDKNGVAAQAYGAFMRERGVKRWRKATQ